MQGVWGLRRGAGDGKARRIQSWHLGDGVTEVGGCPMCPGDNSFPGGIVMCVELVFPGLENAGRPADW